MRGLGNLPARRGFGVPVLADDENDNDEDDDEEDEATRNETGRY